MTVQTLVAESIDLALEATVALSFSRFGYQVRNVVFHWSDQPARPMTGKVVIVTGATSGLGLEAATRLAALGAAVCIVGRDPERTEAARDRIAEASASTDIEVGIADLADLDQVRTFAAQFSRTHDRLDAIINNAGALVHQRQLTVNNIELTAQTHVVAPFLLTHDLLPLLSKTSQSRVITVASGGMYTESLSIDQLEMATGTFNGVKAYAQAKRAQVILNQLWADRAAASGVIFQAMHPGWVDTPGVATSLPDFYRLMGPWLRTPQQGADTMVWLASAREPLASNGQFWLDRRRRWTNKVPWTRTSNDDADELWDWVQDKAAIKTDDHQSMYQRGSTR